MGLLVPVAIAGTLVLSMGTSASAGAPAAAPGDADKVTRLTRQIKALEAASGGRLEQLRDARLDAGTSLRQVQSLGADLERARSEVATLAASQYINNGMDPSVQVLGGGDPRQMLDGATIAAQLSEQRAARVRQIETLRAQQERTRREAETKIKKLEADVREIAGQKERVRALLKKFKPESPMVGSGGMTPRMVAVRNEIESELGPFLTIGCTRPGDPQDHGTGRACDFMESTGGKMPSADRVAHGDQVAAYAIKHAGRLGIKYIIWRQRIYDMRNPGWRAMSDRGSITQNHFDHNHISVF
ncbi:hypothetical protein ACGFNU_35645 [Spirillospora sp. NPDC048911]|uniref:hypothetical protein n=1 Tax=Spirillospora sp. NPDC048911 TaxID=3364527 RepID=UPI003713C8C5